MEAWITCEKNRKFSEALETLLLFLLMFFSAPRSAKASVGFSEIYLQTQCLSSHYMQITKHIYGVTAR